MKKFKKLLAGLLTGAMLLGSMSVSAFAEDATASKTPVIIDEGKTGSITIHKYEYKEMPQKKEQAKLRCVKCPR